MEMGLPFQEEKIRNTDEKKPLVVVPCKLCGSLVIESYYELHLSKICRRKNSSLLGGFIEEDDLENDDAPNEEDEDEYLDEEGEEEDEEEGFSKKELQFIMANFRRKISSCIQRNVDISTIVRYIVR